jgi:hypothetical protein
MPASPPPAIGDLPDGGQGRLIADAARHSAVGDSFAGQAGPARAAGIKPAAHAKEKPPAWLGRIAVTGIVISTALMLLVCFLGPSVSEPPLSSAHGGPLFFTNARPGPWLVADVLWIALAVGAAGVAAGLAGVKRGWRPRPQLLIAGSLIGVILLMLVPPIGSTDLMDDAIYGRISALGHSPYTMTPHQLRRTHDPVATFAPKKWRRIDSLYGPLTTLTQAAASKLGGDSASRTMFWLKVWNALAFLAVALALDRFLRANPARRIRAHLMWTVNPLMLLAVMAGGHNDVLGIVLGLLAVLGLRRLDFKHGLLAGLLFGLAMTIKAPFAIFGLGLAIAALRSPRALAGLGIGAAVVVLPGYALAGGHAVRFLLAESAKAVSLAQPWQLATDLSGHLKGGTGTQAIALLATVALAGLLLWRMPAGPPALPAVRPVLALTLAWLVWSPLQRAWYDVLLFPLLALMPATRLDWIVLARAFVGAFAQLPGNTISNRAIPAGLLHATHLLWFYLAPLALLGLALFLAWMCLTMQLGTDAGVSPPERVPVHA